MVCVHYSCPFSSVNNGNAFRFPQCIVPFMRFMTHIFLMIAFWCDCHWLSVSLQTLLVKYDIFICKCLVCHWLNSERPNMICKRVIVWVCHLSMVHSQCNCINFHSIMPDQKSYIPIMRMPFVIVAYLYDKYIWLILWWSHMRKHTSIHSNHHMIYPILIGSFGFPYAILCSEWITSFLK